MASTRPDPTDPVAEAARGDARARARLVAEHGPALWGVCRRLAAEPEDVYQEVWAKAFRALPDFDPDGPAAFRSWLLVLAHRHLVDLHRRARVRGEVVALPDALGTPADAEHTVATRETRDRLEDALARLPAPMARVVVLHHLHDVPLDQVAAEEGVGVNTVKSRLHRGRARLAALLGGSR